MPAMLSQPPLPGVETPNTTASPLLSLYPELRRIVFGHVLLEHPEWSITTWTTGSDKSLQYFDTKTKKTINPRMAKPQVQLMLVCRAINIECRDMIWKYRFFVFLQTPEFYRLFRWNNDAFFKLNRMKSISNVELIFDYSSHKKKCLIMSYLEGKYSTPCEITNIWQNLKRMKVYLYNSHPDENDVYEHFSPEAMEQVRKPRDYYENGENIFVLFLRLLRLAVDKYWLPEYIPQADGSRRKVERILDFDFNWNTYHYTIHEKNWDTISSILKACHHSFGGGELWAGGVLCWKDNVMQAHMKSIEDLRTHFCNNKSIRRQCNNQ